MSERSPIEFSLPALSEEEWLAAKAITEEEWAKVRLPPGWQERPVPEGSPFEGHKMAQYGKASVIFSVGQELNGWWLHVSYARKDRMPTYMELAEVMRIFIGRDRRAIQVFAAESRHVNIHLRCLHLWCCLDSAGDGLPDFGRYGTI